ncbi:hypothetical protein DN752_07495 [Echinicola strongylocentroti]|uniref:Uncharacterized protein n=1 Tax=Echinicola strongylocentroti TaxID=1795355 RepID=A0A2Z4IH35_9BACT|nr:hypothetical protein DN752_07495 [Echinicola strongylocentroti]
MAQMIMICADFFLKLEKPICITKGKGVTSIATGNIKKNLIVFDTIIFLALYSNNQLGEVILRKCIPGDIVLDPRKGMLHPAG